MSEIPHPDFDPEIDRVVRVDPDAPAPEPESPLQPYQVVAQLKLFLGGLMGQAVTVWSKAEGQNNPYPATQVTMEEGRPLVVSLTDEDPKQAVLFAAGYVCGWHESQRGDLEDLDIWLEPHQGDQS